MVETGHFASLWHKMADKLGVATEFLETDWRRGADPQALATRLFEDTTHQIKAVCVVHNETSTGCTSPIAKIRAVMDDINHPALLMVDTISSLASIDYRHDEWGVDVTVAGSQKGLLLPPGLSFNAVSQKALEVARSGVCRALIGTGMNKFRLTRMAHSHTLLLQIYYMVWKSQLRCYMKKA